jgi:heme-degrading monooxygenase HmoA
MSFISITRLHLRSKLFTPQFLLYAMKSAKQAERAPGFIAGKLMGGGANWTVTEWESEEAMRAYMINGSHRAAMPKLLHWCDEASIVNWDQDGQGLPSMQEAHRRMRDEGRVSKVNQPSPDHLAKRTAEPECILKGEQILKAKRR